MQLELVQAEPQGQTVSQEQMNMEAKAVAEVEVIRTLKVELVELVEYLEAAEAEAEAETLA